MAKASYHHLMPSVTGNCLQSSSNPTAHFSKPYKTVALYIVTL